MLSPLLLAKWTDPKQKKLNKKYLISTKKK